MKYIIVLLLGLFAASFSGYAQEYIRCSSAEYLKEHEERDPAFALRRLSIEASAQQWIAGHSPDNQRSIVTIPVVFHLLYNDTSQYLDDAVIQSQLDVINEDYRRMNADSGQTPLAFRAVAADCEIEFCLAKRTPDNQVTNGIIRKYTNVTAFSNYDNTKFSNQGGDDAWDATRYLNIWVAAFTNQSFLGLGTFPGVDPEYDGVIINYKACGRIGSHLLTHYNKGRSLTHEIGHWLNLKHVWGDDGGNCGLDDDISDTPLQASENYGCPNYPKTDICTASFPGIMFMNYLDYTDDECMNIFTQGQKAKMFATLNVARSGILSSNGCIPVGIEENDFKKYFSVIPNPVTERLSVVKSKNTDSAVEINGIEIMNVTGVRISEYSLQTREQQLFRDIDVSNLTPGIYFLRVITGHGVAVFKIVKHS